MSDAEATAADRETLLSFLLKASSKETVSGDGQPQTLHPFASTKPDDPVAFLNNIINSSSVLQNSLQSYSSFLASDFKLISNLRQGTALIHNFHNSEQEVRRRIDALRNRNRPGYGEPVPLDRESIIDWCISRLEYWGKRNGMEMFKEDEKNGRMTLMLGGKILVIEVELNVRRNTPEQRISVSNVKTSHALPSGGSENALAERSASLDAFILQTWNSYLEEVQSHNTENSMRASLLARDIQENLEYLMKLDSLAVMEGNQGIRWFNDLGLMTTITENITRTEANSLVTFHTPVVPLDIFLSRAHALAIPYLVAPAMSFIVHLSPVAYCSLLQASGNVFENRTPNSTWKLDIPVSVLRKQLTNRLTRPPGTILATLLYSHVSTPFISLKSPTEYSSPTGRPSFRLFKTSNLSETNYTFLRPSKTNFVEGKVPHEWVLDFTDGGRSEGIVIPHFRMREIESVLHPMGNAPMNHGMQLQGHMPEQFNPGNWISLLLGSKLPPTDRYFAAYKSPSQAFPDVHLHMPTPIESGFLLQHVPVRSLREVYGILEIVRDQCWINETINAVDWEMESLMSDIENEQLNQVAEPSDELEALLSGTYTPRRIPVTVSLPREIPILPYNINGGISDVYDTDSEPIVPGLSSNSASAGPSTPPPCIVLTFSAHGRKRPDAYRIVIVLRQDRTRQRGVRLDVSIAPSEHDTLTLGAVGPPRLPRELIEKMEEGLRRGGAFSVVGRIWAWIAGDEKM